LSLNREPESPLKKEVREESVDLSSFDASSPCRKCGSPTRSIRKQLEVTVEGTRISIYGVKIMGGEITKNTATRVEYEITGKECSEGHLFYDDVVFRKKPICPLCFDPLMAYGTSLFSCSRCNKHFPMNEWPDPDPERTLREEGWEEI
ncbi:MAG: hypothetical protein U9R75_04815, partial [Candidatus Thermoplasmatota archaeon]|nr:hypothetical protein [Candidatus Thermoplasmatota archaeon]